MLKKAGTLKEYFVRIEGNSPEGWARVLLTYCCSYDYRSSKFATEENIQLFNTHVFGALVAVVKKLSQSGRILGELPYDDCRVCGKAFEGAVCSSASRYTIDVEYCSFSRSHELRFLVGDVVKYAENKIRQHISVKSKLTVYSLPNDVREVIDEYFADALPYRRKTPIKPRVEEYDILYDLPAKKLDISNAEKIEKESWMTTKELVEAFEDSPEEAICVCESQISQKDELRDNAYGEGSLIDALGEYAECAVSLLDGNCMGAISFADKKGEPIEMVVDRINEIAVEIIGDILIEDNGNGFSIVDDYTDFLKITEK